VRTHYLKHCKSIALALLLSGASLAAGREGPPNVVFILVDDLGWMDLGYQGSPVYQSPNIDHLTDRLTHESIQFLEKNKDQPLLLFLSFYTVHTPIQALDGA
jgi:hypothetical protein